MGKVLPNNNNNLWIDILFTWRVKNNGIENIQRVKTVRNITRGKKAIKFTSEWVVKGAFGVLSKPKNITIPQYIISIVWMNQADTTQKQICYIRDVTLYEELRKYYSIYDVYRKKLTCDHFLVFPLEMPMDYTIKYFYKIIIIRITIHKRF